MGSTNFTGIMVAGLAAGLLTGIIIGAGLYFLLAA